MNILIVTGGNIEIDFALDFLKEKKFDEIIAVDGALSFFDKVGEKIKKVGKLTHIVGDFDTISAEILKKYQMDAHIRCHSFNPEKDYTGIECMIADSHNCVRMIQKEAVVRKPFGKYISLIPVTECLKGVDLEGFKYPLRDRTVYLGESLCVSNELAGAEGKIRIREGIALLIESKD